jgi:hypothetical protein
LRRVVTGDVLPVKFLAGLFGCRVTIRILWPDVVDLAPGRRLCFPDRPLGREVDDLAFVFRGDLPM